MFAILWIIDVGRAIGLGDGVCVRWREPIAIVTAIECHELVVERVESRDCRFAYRRGISCSMELGGVWA